MADAVQNQMEKMIPELEEFQQRNLFSKEEIHQIVEKRREFEYLMKRIPLQTVDALRYIEYEMKLDALRKKRKQRLGLKKALLTDHAGTRRLHAIFNRLLYKRAGQVDLWLQYIEFCKAQESSKILSKVFSRALQVHPRSEAIWIEAASYEFAFNQSIESARVLMQRAIRINKHCQRLWHEYFRLELLYIQKIIARREILQLDPLGAHGPSDQTPTTNDQPANSNAMILIDELPEEKQASARMPKQVEREPSEKEKTRQAILEGAIPRIIYMNAIQTIPDELAFRLQFVQLCDLFRGRVFARNVANCVIESCLESFADDEALHVVFCERPLVEFLQESDDDDDDDDDNTERKESRLQQAEQQCLARFDQSQTKLTTAKMHHEFVLWLLRRTGQSAGPCSRFLIEFAKKTVTTLLKNKSQQQPQQQQQESSPALLLACIEFVERCEGTEAAHNELSTLLHANQTSVHEASLWLRLVQLMLKLQEPNWQEDRSGSSPLKRRRLQASKSSPPASASTVHQVEQILTHALTKVTCRQGQFELYSHLLLVAQLAQDTPASKIQKLFDQALASQQEFSPEWHQLRLRFLTWSFAEWTPQQMEHWIKKQLQRPLLPNDDTLEFLRTCVRLESARVQVQIPFVKQLYEKMLDLFGATHQELWVEFIGFLRADSRFAEANQVHARALRVFPTAIALHQLQ